MDLYIEQSCPSCGAPVTLHEDDTLVQCEFCDVKNFMVAKGVLRFVLPHKVPENVSVDEMFYIPYIRFKGNVFSCRGKKVEYRIVDTTHLGCKGEDFPVSLGLRPQAMKVMPVTSGLGGYFLARDEKVQDVFERAANLTNALSKQSNKTLFHQAFIGETVSYIYLPAYIQNNVLHDAVLNKKIARMDYDDIRSRGGRFKRQWEPRFLSTICPHCGDTLDGHSDSLVLTCSNCSSAWREKEGTFQKVKWETIWSKYQGGIHLPFWKITPRYDGIELKTFADLLRVTNYPKVIRPHHQEFELALWVPAFKVRPKLLLHLAKGISFSQEALQSGSSSKVVLFHPVTLPLKEAKQAMKSILADSTLNKKKLFPLLPGISLKMSKSRLIFLPFSDRGHDYVQDHTGVAVAKAVLHFAKDL